MTRFLLPCQQGLEEVVAQDASALGASRVEILPGRVLVEAEPTFFLRANLAHPTATRVQMVLAEGSVGSPEECARLAKDVDWARVFDPAMGFAVECLRVGDHAWTSQDVSRAVGAALCASTGARVRLHAPEVRIHVHVRDARAQIAVDTTGRSLHERVWRTHPHPAALNPCLASALVAWSGWPGDGGVLLDPMTGGGTIPIEADFRARRRAVNLARSDWAFTRLRIHDEERYQAARDEAACGARDEPFPILGSDVEARHVEAAAEAGRRAAAQVAWRQADFADLPRSDGLVTLIANPPWGLRMAQDGVASLLRERILSWSREGPVRAVLLVAGRGFEQRDPRPVLARGLVCGGAYCRALSYAFP